MRTAGAARLCSCQIATGGKDFRRTYSAQLTFLPQCATIKGMVAAFANPVNFAKLVAQKPLNSAEQKFMNFVTGKAERAEGIEGNMFTIGNTCPTQPIDGGENANVIRAELIRFCVWGGDNEHQIQGNLICVKGAVISGELDLLHVDTRFALAFVECRFTAGVKMMFAKCPGLRLNGSHLAQGITANGMQVSGDMSLHKISAHGLVVLDNTKVDGFLDCSDSTFLVPDKESGNHDAAPPGFGKCAFQARNMRVSGHLDLQKSAFNGCVVLEHAYIGRDLYYMAFSIDGGVSHEKDLKNDLVAFFAEIKGGLFLQELQEDSVIALNFARAGSFAYSSSTPKNFKIFLDGFAYQHSHNTAKEIKSLVMNHTQREPFLPQPFEQAAKVLVSMGRNKDARGVLFEMEKRITAELSGPRKLLRRLWQMATGYNHGLLRMAMTSAFVILLGAAIFGAGNERGYIVPHQPVVLANANYKAIVHNEKAHVDKCAAPKRPRLRPTEAAECLFPGYPRFDALWFSMDIFLPTSPLHQELYWYPHPRADDIFWRYFLLGWYWLQVMSGWVLTSVFVLTFTGIMQRSQASWSGK